MNILGLIFFIIFLLGAIAIFVVGILNVLKSVKGQGKVIPYAMLTKRLLYFSIAFAVSLTTSLLFIYLWNGIDAKWYEYFAAAAGGLIFGLSLFLAVHFFILHYYGKEINTVLDKWLFRGLIFFSISAFVFLFITLEGFADYINLTKPLSNGISFSELWAYPGQYGPDSSITFYAICILAGALIVYFYCDHRMYVQYGKHGLLESTFLVAFPAGIVGARIFWVIGEWNSTFLPEALNVSNFEELIELIGHIIDIRAGGLTILGGALTGIVLGVLWFMWRRRGYNIFVAADIIVPAILVAQAVGRWGNFFNCEVHGIEMSGEYWQWLPKIIYNNIQFGHGTEDCEMAAPGNIFVPLFLIEGAINLLGFFLLSQLFGKKLRRITDFGDLALGYFIWYGLVRGILEPLRDEMYIMDSFWSWSWSLAFIILGALGIILNHTIRNAIRRKKGTLQPQSGWFKTGLINTIVFSTLGVSMVAGSIAMIAVNEHVLEVGFSTFNLGLIILTVGISLLGCLAISIPYMIRGHREMKRAHA